MEIVTPKCSIDKCNESAVGFRQHEEDSPQGPCWEPFCALDIFRDGEASRICFITIRQAELRLSG